LETLIFEVAALQKDCVEKVCAHCKSPCRERVGYLFGEKDILFLKLSGRKQAWRKNGVRKKGCGLLGPLGCTLGPGSRPFICHHYICHDLEAEMRSSKSGLLPLLHEKFETIDMLRSRMWAEYLDDILMVMNASFEQKFQQAAGVVCKQGLFPFPVNDYL
jgi:hypothetical protein